MISIADRRAYCNLFSPLVRRPIPCYDARMNRPAIVLVQPRYPVNLGLACRAMANFGLSDLVLVAPRCDPACTRAKKFALRGAAVLGNAAVLSTVEDLRPRYDFLVGTTRLGGRYRSHRFPPQELPPLLAHARRPAIVFGNESRGLNDRELAAMDALATLPTEAGEKGSVNLAVAVALFAYALSRPGAAPAAPSDPAERRRFASSLADGLTRAGVLKPGDRRHGRGRLYAILEGSAIGERDLRFLWRMLREWEARPSAR